MAFTTSHCLDTRLLATMGAFAFIEGSSFSGITDDRDDDEPKRREDSSEGGQEGIGIGYWDILGCGRKAVLLACFPPGPGGAWARAVGWLETLQRHDTTRHTYTHIHCTTQQQHSSSSSSIVTSYHIISTYTYLPTHEEREERERGAFIYPYTHTRTTTYLYIYTCMTRPDIALPRRG